MVTDIYFLNPTENMLCKIENYLRKSEYEEETINDSTYRFRKGETFIDVCEGGDSVGKYITVVCFGVNNEMFLCRELIAGYLDGITGEYATPEGYLIDEQEAEEFDQNFPYKEKKKLPGQIF